MKKTFTPYITLFVTCIISSNQLAAQAPISSYLSVNGAQYMELISTSTTYDIDQSPTGANAVWNFDQLTAQGASVDNNPTPTAIELSTYPGTTNISDNYVTIIPYSWDNRTFIKKTSSQISLTGMIVKGSLTVNYSGHNPVIGSFPMSYGYSHSDVSSGTWSSGGYSGTCSGTITSGYDAYGSMTLHIDASVVNYTSVRRFKSTQTITLNYGIVSNAGTVTQTTYSYYDASIPYPVPFFKSTTTIVNVPMLIVANQTIKQLENLVAVASGVEENTTGANEFQLYPNPTLNTLNIDNVTTNKIQHISIADMSGKKVLECSSDFNRMDVSELQKGIYFITFTSEKGIVTEKFVKE